MAILSEKQRELLAQATRLADRGDYADAVEILRRLLKKNPNHPDVLHQLALADMHRGRYADAVPILEKLTRRAPGHSAGFVHLAHCHRHLGAYDRGLKAADAALAIRRNDTEALTAKAEILHVAGDHQGGYDLLKPHATGSTAGLGLVFEFSRLADRLGHADEARSGLEALTARDGIGDDLRSNALFELASVYESFGEYERAWATCDEANTLQSDRFDPSAHEAMIDSVIAAWTADGVAALPRARLDTETPVFVVGMPRSGTSLVEQILASHPDVYGAGELPDVFRLISRLQPHTGSTPAYIDDLSVLTQASVDDAAGTYLKSITTRSRRAARIVDKQVFNFLYLGAIRLMFPKARVIHCVRDPRDVAVSCFFQSFMGSVYFASRLAHIGVFFAAYRRLMNHWDSILDGPLLEVAYEDLTSDQETVTRRLIDFVGLDWDDRCLRFHENTRVVRTATIDQVRRPMYRSSVGRWTNYKKQLEPILANLSS